MPKALAAAAVEKLNPGAGATRREIRDGRGWSLSHHPAAKSYRHHIHAVIDGRGGQASPGWVRVSSDTSRRDEHLASALVTNPSQGNRTRGLATEGRQIRRRTPSE